MTLKILQERGLEVGVIFSGDPHPSTESIIQKMTGVSVIGRVAEETEINKEVIKRYAHLFREKLLDL